MEAGDINIYGRLRSGTSEKVLAITDEIKDVHYDKTQAQINSEVGTLAVRVGNLEGEFDDGGIISAIETEITAQAGLIETKVSQTDFDENNNIINEHFSDIRQTADQIQLTVTENKHELDGRLIEQQSQITQQSDLIELKVSRDDYDADGALIQEQFSTIEQTATQIEATVTENKRISDEQYQETSGQLLIQSDLIETKVSQTDYDADNVVREQRYSQIEQTAEQIQSTVAYNKNEADGSFQNVQSLITQQADLISTKVSQVEYDANNLQFSERFSSIEQTADHITSTVEEYRLQSNESISALQTQILQQSDQILLKAEKAELDSVQSVLSNSIGELSVRADGISASVTGIQRELDSHDETLGAYYQWLTSLQTQVDGEIDTWFKPYSPLRNVAPEGQEPQWELDPTVSPYSDWLIEEQERGAEVVRDAHVRDIFYNTATGYGYIFTGTGEKGHRVYDWSLITDSAVVEALAAAARAQTTADGKMRTFLQPPVPPYQPGDMWIKPHTVTIDGSEVTYNEVWNCITEKTDGQAFSISDWAKSDNYDAEITKANLKVLADAIVGQVTAYDSNGLITNKSTIEQKAGQIRLSVANTAIGTALATNGSINSALLDTGIDITQGKIVVTANNFMVQDQSGRVALMTSGNKIKAAYLEIDGIFSTTPGSTWMTNVASLNTTARGYANTAESNANDYSDTQDASTLQTAKDYADGKAGDAYDNAVSYVTESVVPSVTQAYQEAIAALDVPGLADDVDDLEDDVSSLQSDLSSAILRIQATEGGLSDIGYLAEALINGQTVAVGGLVLSSLIQLGSTTGPDSSWQVWSGINGVYNSSVAGNGIAAWYGGAMLDRYYSGNTDANRAAKTLFRMDGSGYLASNNLWWGANGELHINNNTIIDNTGNLTLSQLASVVAELASYFTVVDYVKDGTTRHYLKLNASGAGGLDGFVSDGFIAAGGVGSSSGGGGGVDLDRVWESLTNNIDFPNVKINIAHIPALAISDITGLQTALDAKENTISDLATIRARADEGHVAYEGLPTISDCLLSLQSQLDSVASRDNFDELTAAAFYSDVAAVSSLYAETMSIGGADLSSTLSSLASRASDLETRASNLETRATNLEGRASTLEGYFTNGSANSALRLTTVSKTAWGQTYWTSGGIPDSVSGNMSDVGNISMNGSISGATTITASGLIKTTNYMQAARFYLSDSVYFVLDSNGVKLEGAGFYTDSFITAGGAGSSGGGGGDIDLDRVWESLTNNIDFPNTKINTAHIPDTASIYGYLKGNQTITLTGVVTGSGTTSIATSIADGALSIAKVAGLQSDLNTIATLLQSLQSQVDSVATRNMFDELSATVAYFDAVVASSARISAITGELSGNATTASYLVSSSYGAGGGLNPIYFSSGRPIASSSTAGSASVPVYMDGGTITAITPSSLFSGLSSSAGTNLSVTIAGQNRTATLYATYDSASENISDKFGIVSDCLRSLQSQVDSVSSRDSFDELNATVLYADVLSVGSDFGIGGNVTIGGTLGVTGATNLYSTLRVSGATTLSSTLDVTGATTVWGRLGVGAAASSPLMFYVSGKSGLDGDTSIGGALTVGTASANKNATIYGYLYIGSATSYIRYDGTGLYSNVGFASASYITAGGVASSSDRRLKDEIEDVCSDRALAVLMQLKPKEWVWNEKNDYFSGKRGAGLVAQDVEDVLPFAVMETGEYKSLNYSVLHAYEIAGLQDHEKRIRALEKENAELRRKLELINL